MEVVIFKSAESYQDWLYWNDAEVVSVVVFADTLVITYKKN